jgi:DNA-binding NtrC family response regulator
MSVVLVIEDEAPLLILAESVLKGEGYETLTAATVAEAQAIISSDQKLDVVVTDITLMEDAEAGLQIGQFLRQMRPGIPVLYTTGRGVTDGMIQMSIEPSGYLAKPYTDKQLTAAVAELLRGDPNKQRKAENE